jgi:hypothetical protein
VGEALGVISAVISVLGAIAAGVLTTWSGQRQRRLEHALELQKHAATKAERAAEVLSRYREPLLIVTNSFQARIFNVLRDEYLPKFLHSGDREQERYAREFTIYSLAEYLCWVVIIRRELRFLDLGDEAKNREFNERMMAVENTLSSQHFLPHFMIFRGQQRALGELLMVPVNGGDQHEAMTYTAFCARLDGDPGFRDWFQRLLDDVDQIASCDDEDNMRLIRTQHALIDLLDFLDPEHTRLTTDRSKYNARPRVASYVSAQRAGD